MKSLRMRGVAALLGLFTLTGAAGAANVEDIVRETQRLSVEDGQISMIWWIPFQFWDESIKGNTAVPDAAREQILSVMADYTIVALLRARPGSAGLEDIQPKEELLKNTRVVVNGKTLEALSSDMISPAAMVLLSQLKPVLAQAAGQVGEGLDFLVYSAKADGKTPLDAAQPGALAITFYGKTQQWRLPLGSLLPPKLDKNTGEQFPGNYAYNPFTGKALDEKQPVDKKPVSKKPDSKKTEAK